MINTPNHSFHIPVMGLAYTIDTPVKVARFGIASVISIVEDNLIEMMRRHYCQANNQTYIPINTDEPDYRAKRITDYLNLVNKIVQTQIEQMKQAPFEKGTDLTRYFEMLPDDNKLKKTYCDMLATQDVCEQKKIATYLKAHLVAGSIDVNVMTKTDRNHLDKQGSVIEDGSDAIAALRGYANSNLTNSSIVFSAGMNPRLYNYLEKCTCFDVTEDGGFDKKVIIKVSDYRSALIQGKYLAKKGIWVSEFRIESGLNCGGHAFATDGFLLGPILQEFKDYKKQLIDSLFEIYNAVTTKKTGRHFVYPPQLKITVQGGIGTAAEDLFLRDYFQVDGTGWGTPFLLVPEATTVDEETLALLSKAKKQDVVLSNNSPLGVRFHYLQGTTSAIEKQQRIDKGKAGSPCTEKHLAFNTEFTTEPICTASHKYQQLKIAQLKSLDLPEKDYNKQLSAITDKECLCIGLSNAASLVYNTPLVKKLTAVNVCPGPNIAYFTRVVSLQTMVDHIYGRTNIMHDTQRPNLFIKELELYLNYLTQQWVDEAKEPDEKRKKYYREFVAHLRDGIQFYLCLPRIEDLTDEGFLTGLSYHTKELDLLEQQMTNELNEQREVEPAKFLVPFLTEQS